MLTLAHARRIVNGFSLFFDPAGYTKNENGNWESPGGRTLSDAQYQAAVQRVKAQPSGPRKQGQQAGGGAKTASPSGPAAAVRSRRVPAAVVKQAVGPKVWAAYKSGQASKDQVASLYIRTQKAARPVARTNVVPKKATAGDSSERANRLAYQARGAGGERLGAGYRPDVDYTKPMGPRGRLTLPSGQRAAPRRTLDERIDTATIGGHRVMAPFERLGSLATRIGRGIDGWVGRNIGTWSEGPFAAFFDPSKYTRTQAGTYKSQGGRVLSAAQYEAAVRSAQASASRPKGPGSPVPARVGEEQIKAAVPEAVYGRYQAGQIKRPTLMRHARKHPEWAAIGGTKPAAPGQYPGFDPEKAKYTPPRAVAAVVAATPAVKSEAAAVLPAVVDQHLGGLPPEAKAAVASGMAQVAAASSPGGLRGALRGLVRGLFALPKAVGRAAVLGIFRAARFLVQKAGGLGQAVLGGGGMAAGMYGGMKLGAMFGPLGAAVGTGIGGAIGALAGTGDGTALGRLLGLRGMVGNVARPVGTLLKGVVSLPELPGEGEGGSDAPAGLWEKTKRFAKAALWHAGSIALYCSLALTPFAVAHWLIAPAMAAGATSMAVDALGGEAAHWLARTAVSGLGAGLSVAASVPAFLRLKASLDRTRPIARGDIKLSEQAFDSFAWEDWKPNGDLMVSPGGRKLKRATWERLKAATGNKPKGLGPRGKAIAPAKPKPTPRGPAKPKPPAPKPPQTDQQLFGRGKARPVPTDAAGMAKDAALFGPQTPVATQIDQLRAGIDPNQLMANVAARLRNGGSADELKTLDLPYVRQVAGKLGLPTAGTRAQVVARIAARPKTPPDAGGVKITVPPEFLAEIATGRMPDPFDGLKRQLRVKTQKQVAEQVAAATTPMEVYRALTVTTRSPVARAAAWVGHKIGQLFTWLHDKALPAFAGAAAGGLTAGGGMIGGAKLGLLFGGPLGMALGTTLGGGLGLLAGKAVGTAVHRVASAAASGGRNPARRAAVYGRKLGTIPSQPMGGLLAGMRFGANFAEAPPDPLAELKATLAAVGKVQPLPPFTDADLKLILAAVQRAAGGAAPATFREHGYTAFSWQLTTSRNNHPKAVWQGAGDKPPLYGSQALAAVHQQRQTTGVLGKAKIGLQTAVAAIGDRRPQVQEAARRRLGVVAKTVARTVVPSAKARAGIGFTARAIRGVDRLLGKGAALFLTGLGRGYSAVADGRVGRLWTRAMDGIFGAAVDAKGREAKGVRGALLKTVGRGVGKAITAQAEKWTTVRDNFRRGFLRGLGSAAGKVFGLFQAKFRANVKKLGGGPLAVLGATAIELTAGVADWVLRGLIAKGAPALGTAAGLALAGPAGAGVGWLGGKVVAKVLPMVLPPAATFRGGVMAVVDRRLRTRAPVSAVRQRKAKGSVLLLGKQGGKEEISDRDSRAVLAQVAAKLKAADAKAPNYDPRHTMTHPKNRPFVRAVNRTLTDPAEKAAALRAMAIRSNRYSTRRERKPAMAALMGVVRKQRGGVFAEMVPGSEPDGSRLGTGSSRPGVPELVAGVKELLAAMGHRAVDERQILPLLGASLAAMTGGGEVQAFAWEDWKPNGGVMVSPGGRKLKKETYDRLRAATGRGGDAGGVRAMSPTGIAVDPERFQFKMGAGKGGVVADHDLKGAKFNRDLSGVISVWRDPTDGKTYVVNGHHRLAMAQRDAAPAVDVRYIQASTAEAARAVGALQNIAGGRGTAVDAAKFLRDTGTTPDQLTARGVSLRGAVARDAVKLVGLDPVLFGKVARGSLDVGTAAALAGLPDHDDQRQLAAVVARHEERTGRPLPAAHVADMAKDFALTATAKKSGTLFDSIDGGEDERVFVQRAALKSFIRTQLAKEANDFKMGSSERRAGVLGAVGNQLDTRGNARQAAERSDLLHTFEVEASRVGPVSDELNRLALLTNRPGIPQLVAGVKDLLAAMGHRAVDERQILPFLGAALTAVQGGGEVEAFFDPSKYTRLQDGRARSPGGRVLSKAQFDAAVARHGAKKAPAKAPTATAVTPNVTSVTKRVTPQKVADHRGPSRTKKPATIQAVSATTGVVAKPAAPPRLSPALKKKQTAILDKIRGIDYALSDLPDMPGLRGSREKARAERAELVKQLDALTKPPAASASESRLNSQLAPLLGKLSGTAGVAYDRAVREYPEISERYIQQFGTVDANGVLRGVTLNTDEWRQFFPEYTGTNAADTHEAASYLNDRLFHDSLFSLRGQGNKRMIVLAGGGGSGKGTATKGMGLDEYPIRLDQVSGDFDKLMKKFSLGQANGFAPEYTFIDRSPELAWDGVVSRAVNGRKEGGIARTVPLEIALKANLDARAVALRVLKERPDIPATVVDNNGEAGTAKILTGPDAVRHLERQQHDFQALLEKLRGQTHARPDLPDDIRQGLVGPAPANGGRVQPASPPRREGARPTDAATGSPAPGVGGQVRQARAAHPRQLTANEVKMGRRIRAAVEGKPEGMTALDLRVLTGLTRTDFDRLAQKLHAAGVVRLLDDGTTPADAVRTPQNRTYARITPGNPNTATPIRSVVGRQRSEGRFSERLFRPLKLFRVA